MPRPKKDNKALNCKIKSNLWEDLDTYCQITGTNKTFIVEKALEKYLKENNIENIKKNVVQIDDTDRMRDLRIKPED